MITFDKFKEVEIKVGTIVSAEKVEGADKLLKLMINVGEENPRQILAGIAQFYSPESLMGKQLPVVVNLEPKTFKGLESQGMILAADGEGRPILLHPDKEVPPGSIVK